jgi:hypothetical protein
MKTVLNPVIYSKLLRHRRELTGLGALVGSIVEFTPTGDPLTETFYYYRRGVAYGYMGKGRHRCCWRQWQVVSFAQLREWVALEQLAAGLRRAVARQRPPQGVPTPAALLRLRIMTRQAIDKADAAEGSPRYIPA